MKKETLEQANKIQSTIKRLVDLKGYLAIGQGKLSIIHVEREIKLGNGIEGFDVIQDAEFLQLKMLELIPEEIKYLEKKFQDLGDGERLVDYDANSRFNESLDKKLNKEWDEFLGTPGDKVIPEITDPAGIHWEQPDRKEITFFFDDHVGMSLDTFNKLKEYSSSNPTGVYIGKMWKAKGKNCWYLCWYTEGDATFVARQRRPIINPVNKEKLHRVLHPEEKTGTVSEEHSKKKIVLSNFIEELLEEFKIKRKYYKEMYDKNPSSGLNEIEKSRYYGQWKGMIETISLLQEVACHYNIKVDIEDDKEDRVIGRVKDNNFIYCAIPAEGNKPEEKVLVNVKEKEERIYTSFEEWWEEVFKILLSKGFTPQVIDINGNKNYIEWNNFYRAGWLPNEAIEKRMYGKDIYPSNNKRK